METWAGTLIPIYPATAKLESWKIGKALQTALPSAQEAVDPLPDSLREGRGLVSLPEALLKIHRPHARADIAAARDRLKWDEAFVLQVALARRRHHADAQLPAVARKPTPDGLLTAFDDRLPFTLTDGQVKVSKEIFDDLATEHPMHRLLQGRSVAERPWWPSAPCSPSSTRVGRPRCSRPPKCSLSSITGRSPR